MSGKKDLDSAKEQRACYGRATSALRDAHREEFDALLTAEYATAGLEVRRRLSEEERAAKAAAEAEAKAAKAEEKRLAKVARLQAELDALLNPEG
jgi:hypothetical protein